MVCMSEDLQSRDQLSIQDEACQLHANRYTLDEIKAALYDRHKSQASTRAWRSKFKEWGIKHRTANTSRIRKTTKSHSRKDQVSAKHATASISLESPVLRYFKDKQVSEDTQYLYDLSQAEQWISLAQVFVAHDYGDEMMAIYYKYLGEWLYSWRRGVHPSQIRQAFGQLRKKAFWDIMRSRTKVVPALYGYFGDADYYLSTNDIKNVLVEPCVERNEFCARSTECRSVASVMLLHTKDQNVPGYWANSFGMEQSAKLILRAWTAGDLRKPEKSFERYIDEDENFDPSCIVDSILEVIPDEHPEIKVKAAEIVAAKYDRYGLFMSDLILNLRALRATQTPLNWRLAEIILRYPGVKPVDYLKRLTDAFNDVGRDMESIDLTKPSRSVIDTLRTTLGDCLEDPWLCNDASDTDRHQVLAYFISAITKAWLDLVLTDDNASQELSASDILKIREDFGGLPELRVSVDAAALSQMAASAYFKSLRPKVLGWESEHSSDSPQNGTDVGVSQAPDNQPVTMIEDREPSQSAEVQVTSSDEDEDMSDGQAPSNTEQHTQEVGAART